MLLATPFGPHQIIIGVAGKGSEAKMMAKNCIKQPRHFWR